MVKKCLYIREKCCNTLQFSLAVTGLDTVSSILNKKSWKCGTGIGTYCKNKWSKLFFFRRMNLESFDEKWPKLRVFLQIKMEIILLAQKWSVSGISGNNCYIKCSPRFYRAVRKVHLKRKYNVLQTWKLSKNTNRNYAFVYIKQLLIEIE